MKCGLFYYFLVACAPPFSTILLVWVVADSELPAFFTIDRCQSKFSTPGVSGDYRKVQHSAALFAAKTQELISATFKSHRICCGYGNVFWVIVDVKKGQWLEACERLKAE